MKQTIGMLQNQAHTAHLLGFRAVGFRSSVAFRLTPCRNEKPSLNPKHPRLNTLDSKLETQNPEAQTL